jgi:phage terminase large subunit-like protein
VTDLWSSTPPTTTATPRTDRETLAPSVVEVAQMLNVRLLGWQQLVLERAFEHERGQLAYREVDLSTMRQVGKSTLILVVAMYRLLASPGSWVTYTSASRLSARRKLLRTWWPMIQRSPLASRFRLIRVNGSESLECTNGSTFLILSGEESSGHGDTLDLAILDEAWSLSELSEQAVRPAMAARANGQLWITSTAGTARSVYWRSKVDAGRAAVQRGDDPVGSLFIEWAAPLATEIGDPATWSSFMPALGRTIMPETVAADMASMPFPEWRRAYCNLWPDEDDDLGWQVIAKDVWEASRL